MPTPCRKPSAWPGWRKLSRDSLEEVQTPDVQRCFGNSEPKKYGQTVSVGPHVFHSDEPSEYGGADEGPTAIELLMSALGVCASVTVQMYAERRQWPLRGVHVEVSYTRAPAEDYGKSDANIGMVDRIDMGVSLHGDLSEDQQTRLFEIAQRCPVHRMLVSQVQIRPKLLVPTSPKSS
jgi:putative redox protein